MVVFGEGPSRVTYMVIGEAPGAEEVEEGRPFVGPSGKLVRAQLARLGITDETYITNVVKERPDENATPSKEQVSKWFPFLYGEMAWYFPNAIVTLGKVALNALTGRTSMKQNHGAWLDYHIPDQGYTPVLTLYHPAYVLYGGIEAEKWGKAWDKLVS